MSDTVKLIVEIPKHLYEVIKNKECTSRNVITTAVENGIPLDDIKSKIKSKIRAKHFSIVEKNDFDNGRTYGYEECLEILDNIGKTESEVT